MHHTFTRKPVVDFWLFSSFVIPWIHKEQILIHRRIIAFYTHPDSQNDPLRWDPGCSPFTYHLPLPRGGGRNQSASPDLPFGGKYSNQLLPLSDRKTVKFRRISRLSSWSLLFGMIGPWFYKLFSSHLFISNWPAYPKTTGDQWFATAQGQCTECISRSLGEFLLWLGKMGGSAMNRFPSDIWPEHWKKKMGIRLQARCQ